ncbi:hypothetical protein B0H34DRAFT_474063 [Crassisporium funariophilum]|nr:hypothetical protein B0H34DRAFT_474063 [Crassisporium funariophilum]
MLDLRSLTTLRSMRFRFWIENEEQDPFSGLIEELEEMSHHNNTGLQELLLDLTIDCETNCRLIAREWKKLDDILGDPSAFPCLRSLAFRVTLGVIYELNAQCEEHLEKFKEMTTRQLTRLSGRENREFHFEYSIMRLW